MRYDAGLRLNSYERVRPALVTLPSNWAFRNRVHFTGPSKNGRARARGNIVRVFKSNDGVRCYVKSGERPYAVVRHLHDSMPEAAPTAAAQTLVKHIDIP